MRNSVNQHQYTKRNANQPGNYILHHRTTPTIITTLKKLGAFLIIVKFPIFSSELLQK